MKHISLLPSEIKKLSKDITDFEKNISCRATQEIDCDSECYCRKQGNHKVTHSLYHKGCTSMKKTSLASVKKTDLYPTRLKHLERKDVFNLQRSQVEVAIKNAPKDVRFVCNKKCKYICEIPHDRPVKLVHTGTDPIMVVESKRAPRQSWSSVLSQNSKTDVATTKSKPSNELAFTRSNKGQAVSEGGAPSRNNLPSSISSDIVSNGTERPGSPSVRSIIVRDKGVQCNQAKKDDRVTSHFSSQQSNLDPLVTLESLLIDLRDFNKKFPTQKDSTGFCRILSDIDLVLQKIKLININSNTTLAAVSYETSKELFAPVERKWEKGETLQKKLEDTCQQLQMSCRQLEEACEKIRKDKDHMTNKYLEKSREVERCVKREIEYQVKLCDANKAANAMSLKLDQYTKSVEELSIHVRRLEEENKNMEHVEVTRMNIQSQLMETSRDNDRLNAQVKLMILEREKNRVLLEIKEQELTKLKTELKTISGLVYEKMQDNGMCGDNLIISRLSSALELTEPRELAFSSPDGSFTSPSKSWRALSTIVSPTKPKPPARHVQSRRELFTGTQKKETKEAHSERPPLESIKHLKNELRELFAQMKRQTEISESIIPDIRNGDESTPWSNITDSSDGYISITEAELS